MKNSKLLGETVSKMSLNVKKPKSKSPGSRSRRASKSPELMVLKPNIHEALRGRSRKDLAEISEKDMFKRAWTILNSPGKNNNLLLNLESGSLKLNATSPSTAHSENSALKSLKDLFPKAISQQENSFSDNKPKANIHLSPIQVKSKSKPIEITENPGKSGKKPLKYPKLADLYPGSETNISTMQECPNPKAHDNVTVASGITKSQKRQEGKLVKDLLEPQQVKATGKKSEKDERDNININFSLSVTQLENNGNANSCNDSRDENSTPIRTLRIAKSRNRNKSKKVELSMQTDLLPEHLKSVDNPCGNESMEETVVELLPRDFDNGSTSAFPSVTPSAQGWRKRQPKALDSTVPVGKWTDYVTVQLPTVISYTGESIKNLLRTADHIINTCIIPPDDNPMTEEEMNRSEDKVSISLMRLVGVPKSLRHNIYKESLSNVQALQDVSFATIDVLNNVLDWIMDGNCGGREEILKKVRILASITTDFNPGSEIWQQFEKDLSVLSAAVAEVMKDGMNVVRKASETVLNNLNGPLETAKSKLVESISNLCLKITKSEDETPNDVLVQNTFMKKGVFYGSGGVVLKKQQSLENADYILGSKRSRSLSVKRGRSLSTNLASSSARTRCRSLDRNFGNFMEKFASDDEGISNFNEALVENFVSNNGNETFVLPRIHSRIRDTDGTLIDSLSSSKSEPLITANTHSSGKSLWEREIGEVEDMAWHADPGFGNFGFNTELRDEELSYRRRKTDAFLEAPLATNYGYELTRVLSSACQSVKSTILLKAQSVATYFPVFKSGPFTPIFGETPEPRSRDEKVSSKGVTRGLITYDTDEDEVPEPNIPPPPPIPKRQNTLSLANVGTKMNSEQNIAGMTKGKKSTKENAEKVAENQTLSEVIKILSSTSQSENVKEETTYNKNEDVLPLKAESASLSDSGSGCALVKKENIPETKMSASSRLEEPTNISEFVVEKLKGFWPSCKEGLSPDDQLKIAMKNYLQDLGSDAAGAVVANENFVTTNGNASASLDSNFGQTDKQETVKSERSIVEEQLIEDKTACDEEGKLHDELSQLELIVQRLCKEVCKDPNNDLNKTKLDPVQHLCKEVCKDPTNDMNKPQLDPVQQLCKEVCDDSNNDLNKPQLDPEHLIFNVMSPLLNKNSSIHPKKIDQPASTFASKSNSFSTSPTTTTSCTPSPSKIPKRRSSKIPVRRTDSIKIMADKSEAKTSKKSSTVSLYPPKPIIPNPSSTSIHSTRTFLRPNASQSRQTFSLPRHPSIFFDQPPVAPLLKHPSKLKIISTVPETYPGKYSGLNTVKRDTSATVARLPSRGSLQRTNSYRHLFQLKQAIDISPPNPFIPAQGKKSGYAPSTTKIRSASVGPIPRPMTMSTVPSRATITATSENPRPATTQSSDNERMVSNIAGLFIGPGISFPLIDWSANNNPTTDQAGNDTDESNSQANSFGFSGRQQQ